LYLEDRICRILTRWLWWRSRYLRGCWFCSLSLQLSLGFSLFSPLEWRHHFSEL